MICYWRHCGSGRVDHRFVLTDCSCITEYLFTIFTIPTDSKCAYHKFGLGTGSFGAQV